MITTDSITAWLGHVADELTDEQREQFEELVNRYETEIVASRPGYGTSDYEPTDYYEEDTAAWVAALEIVLGELDLAQRGRTYREAKDAVRQGAVMAALSGVSEVQAAADAGISRLTLRKALGK